MINLSLKIKPLKSGENCPFCVFCFISNDMHKTYLKPFVNNIIITALNYKNYDLQPEI